MIHKSCAILMVGKDGYLLGVYCYCVLDHAQRWIESTVLEVPPGVLPTHYFLPTPSTRSMSVRWSYNTGHSTRSTVLHWSRSNKVHYSICFHVVALPALYVSFSGCEVKYCNYCNYDRFS
jgi:hypothetical protein